MSELSTVVSAAESVATGGISGVYKWGAILGVVMALCIGSFFYGDHVGTLSEKNAVLQNATKQEAKVITIEKTQTVVDTQAVDNLQRQLDAANSINKSLQDKISSLQSQYLTVVKPATPATANAPAQPATCELSKDWVSIYNQSVEDIK